MKWIVSILLIPVLAALSFGLAVPFVVKAPPDTLVNAIKNIAYTGFPVTSGVPFARGTVSDVNALILENDANQRVPAQFRVTSRWAGDNSVKWVLVDFQADVAARSARVYWITDNAKTALPAGRLSAVDNGTAIEVNTGALRFTVNKNNARFLEDVYLDKNSDGAVTEQIISASGTTGLYMTGEDNVRRPLEDGATAELEYAGSMRASVLIRGHVKNSASTRLEVTIRIWAYEGKPYLRTWHTVTSRDTVWRNFMEVGLDLDLLTAGTRTVTANKRQDADAPFSESFSTASTYQLHLNQTNQSEIGYQYIDLYEYFVSGIKKDGADIAGTAGKRILGYFDLSDGTFGVTVSVRGFWQNYPKQIETDGARLSVKLWPKDVYTGTFPGWSEMFGMHAFGKGRQKTHEVWLNFHAGPAADANAWSLFKQMQKPPFAWAGNGQYANSNACLTPFVDKRDYDAAGLPQRLADGMKVFDRWCEVRYDSMAADDMLGKDNNWWRVDFERFAQLGGPIGGGFNCWGWENFGDFPWVDWYSSQHYDFSYGSLLQYMRSGNYAAMDFIDDFCMHRYDIDNYHAVSDPAHYGQGGGQIYEKGWHGLKTVTDGGGQAGTFDYFFPHLSHTWVAGLLLYWALTGDELAMATVRENVDFVNNGNIPVLIRQWDGAGGTRNPGWGIEILAEVYAMTGERALVDSALVIAGEVLQVERRQGGRGWIANDIYQDNVGTVESSWQHSYLGSAMFQLAWILGDWPAVGAYDGDNFTAADYKNLLIRMVRKLDTTGISPARGSGTDYIPAFMFDTFRQTGGAEDRMILKNLEAVDMFGWYYLMIDSASGGYGDSAMDKARTLFIDGNFYFQIGNPDTLDAAYQLIVDSATDRSIMKHLPHIDESRPFPAAAVIPGEWVYSRALLGVSIRCPTYFVSESKVHGIHGRNQKVYQAADFRRLGVPWGTTQYLYTTAVDRAGARANNAAFKAYPNPGNPCVSIAYGLSKKSPVWIGVYAPNGRLVRVLEDHKSRDAGRHSVVWNGRDGMGRKLASGLYVVRLKTPGAEYKKKITLLK